MIGYPFALPPGVPANRVAILKKAFQDTMNDPEFGAEMIKQKLEFMPKDGETVAGLIAQLSTTPNSIIERYRALVGQEPPG